MRNDRASVRAQHGLPQVEALAQEFALGLQTLQSGETVSGAQRFTDGVGRHGRFTDP
jgi:enoyl-CoA hydratase